MKLIGIGALAFCSLVGCGGNAANPGGASSGSSASTQTLGNTPTNSAGAAASGLPCDIYALLQTNCVGCHGSTPLGGAPMPLETLADLTAPAHSNPSVSVAQMCVTRITSTTAPMPPAPQPPLSAQDVATFQAWVSGGAQAGTCNAPAAGDAGAAMASPYDTPVQCTSGVMTMLREGSNMRPGDTCVSCHAQSGGEAPQLTIGGTVYPTAHEPTNCNGVGVANASVVITDANNKVLTIPVNINRGTAGNFYTTAPVALPFHAKVVYNGAERAMVAAQSSGDCNSCHTESGANSAPGRIMLP